MNKNKTREFIRKPKREYLFSFNIYKEDRLLNFLFNNLKVIPRGKIKSILEHHQVLVNGVPITRYDYLLSKDDEVKIVKHSFKDYRTIKLPFNILYEDNEIIVIDKPSKLLSISSDKESKRTAYRYVSDYVYNKDKKSRIYVVHRLDEDTSGVLIFSKDARLKDEFQNNWNNLVIKRGYYAVVDGVLNKKEDKLVHFLKKSSVNLVYVTGDRKNGKKAITNYKVIKENDKYSLLDINIETGRQNQIRVQLGAINHYVIGDDKYGEPTNPINRLGLHAYLLQIKHPRNGKIMIFKSNLPSSFKQIFSK